MQIQSPCSLSLRPYQLGVDMALVVHDRQTWEHDGPTTGVSAETGGAEFPNKLYSLHKWFRLPKMLAICKEGGMRGWVRGEGRETHLADTTNAAVPHVLAVLGGECATTSRVQSPVDPSQRLVPCTQLPLPIGNAELEAEVLNDVIASLGSQSHSTSPIAHMPTVLLCQCPG